MEKAPPSAVPLSPFVGEFRRRRIFARQPPVNGLWPLPAVLAANANPFRAVLIQLLFYLLRARGSLIASPPPKGKAPPMAVLCLLVEVRGIEPLSENQFTQLSPGAGPDQISPTASSGTSLTPSSHFVHDRFNGNHRCMFTTQMTPGRGSWSSPGRRAALLAAAQPN